MCVCNSIISHVINIYKKISIFKYIKFILYIVMSVLKQNVKIKYKMKIILEKNNNFMS